MHLGICHIVGQQREVNTLGIRYFGKDCNLDHY